MIDFDRLDELSNEQLDELIEHIINFKDFYQRMGLSKDAHEDLIKRRYRKLSVLVHPDKTSHPKAQKAFVELQEAYACLSSPELRTLYDENGGQEEIDSQNTTFEDILKSLRSFGVRIPPEDKWPEFIEFVRVLQANGSLEQMYDSKYQWSSLGALAACFCMTTSFPLFCILVALGPVPFGFSVFWEELMAQFDKSTLNQKLASTSFPSTVFSMTRNTAAFTLIWCSVLGYTGVEFSRYMITWGMATIGFNKEIQEKEKEQLVEWLMTEVEDNEVTFTNIFSVNTLSAKEKLEDWLIVDVSDEASLENSWTQVSEVAKDSE